MTKWLSGIGREPAGQSKEATKHQGPWEKALAAKCGRRHNQLPSLPVPFAHTQIVNSRTIGFNFLREQVCRTWTAKAPPYSLLSLVLAQERKCIHE